MTHLMFLHFGAVTSMLRQAFSLTTVYGIKGICVLVIVVVSHILLLCEHFLSVIHCYNISGGRIYNKIMTVTFN